MIKTENYLYGISPSNVVDVLKNRRQNEYIPNKLDDGYKVGLVVEGGGMRGLISCAAIDALYQLGFGNCFDSLYGTSAGAINCSYFLSGQITVGTSIYYENLIGKNFINICRWPSPMNIHYLFDDWITRGKALAVDKVLNSPASFDVFTTEVSTGRSKVFNNKELNRSEFIKALRASSSTPMFSTNKETISGVKCNDGLINDGIPIEKAIKDGCTHIVVLLTREYGFRKKETFIVSLLENLRLINYSKQYKAAFKERIEKYNKSLDFIFDKNNDTPNILAVVPGYDDCIISNSETNKDKLLLATRDSLKRVAFYLDEEQSTLRTLRD